jgi:hypothetical protein
MGIIRDRYLNDFNAAQPDTLQDNFDPLCEYQTHEKQAQYWCCQYKIKADAQAVIAEELVIWSTMAMVEADTTR